MCVCVCVCSCVVGGGGEGGMRQVILQQMPNTPTDACLFKH